MVKKLSKILALLMIFCLCFSTAAFAAGESGSEETATTERPQDRWSRECRDLPFAEGHEFQLVTLDDVAWSSGEYSGTPSDAPIPEAMPHFDNPSELPLLILVVGFNNIDYKTDYNWGETIFEGEESLAQYYKDMSFNQFAFVPAKETSAYGTGGNTNTADKANDGVVHVKINKAHGDWYSDADEDMAYYVECLLEAIKEADKYVDFASFDKNGDGELTTDEIALGVVCAGYEGAYGTYPRYGEEYYLWSFAWNIYSGWYFYFSDEYPDAEDFMPAPDGVMVDSYITIPEQLEPDEQEPISVLAHELGHYLGLPDLYDTNYALDYYNQGYSSYGYNYDNFPWMNYSVGSMSVMCSGSWGWDGSKYIPGAFDAWSRCVLGWVDPITVTDGIYDVVSDNGTYNVLRVETGIEGEYYLIENREYSGWDVILDDEYSGWSDNGGLAIWHIDDAIHEEYDPSNAVNDSDHRPGVMPLYMETDNGDVTYIGTLPNDGGWYPSSNWTYRPFYTYDIWNTYYGPALGNVMEFPAYDGAELPADRVMTDVTMEILNEDSAHTIKVKFGDTIEHEHVLTRVEAKKATFAEDGNIEYWVCSDCGTCFADENGEVEIDKEDVIIPKLGFTVEVNGQEITDIEIVEEGYDASYNDYMTGEDVEDLIPLAIVTVPEGTETAKITLNDHVAEYHTYIYEAEPGATGYTEYIDNGFGNMEDVGGMTAPVAKAGTAYDADVLPENQVYRVQTKYDTTTWTSENLYAIKFEEKADNEIIRLAGSNRYDTAIAAADHLKLLSGSDTFDKIIVASGADFPDALSASYLAYKKDAPILLVGKDSGSIKKVTDYINANLSEGGTVYVVGGTGAVSEAVDDAVEGTVERLAGSNRFLTNIEVLKEAGVDGEELLIASGMDYADALSASAAGRPILLVASALTPDQKAYLEANKESFGENAYIIGGTAAVSAAVESGVTEYVGAPERLAGANRYATSEVVAKEFFPGRLDNLVIASGMTFPDGLSGGPVAVAYNAPLVLVANGRVDHATQIFTQKKAHTLIVMGGTGAVSKAIAETIAYPALDM